jgi:hypothetical protein
VRWQVLRGLVGALPPPLRQAVAAADRAASDRPAVSGGNVPRRLVEGQRLVRGLPERVHRRAGSHGRGTVVKERDLPGHGHGTLVGMRAQSLLGPEGSESLRVGYGLDQRPREGVVAKSVLGVSTPRHGVPRGDQVSGRRLLHRGEWMDRHRRHREAAVLAGRWEGVGPGGWGSIEEMLIVEVRGWLRGQAPSRPSEWVGVPVVGHERGVLLARGMHLCVGLGVGLDLGPGVMRGRTAWEERSHGRLVAHVQREWHRDLKVRSSIFSFSFGKIFLQLNKICKRSIFRQKMSIILDKHVSCETRHH